MRRDAIAPPPLRASAVAALEAPEAAAQKQAREALERLSKAIVNLRRAGDHAAADQASHHQLELARIFSRVGDVSP